MVFPGPSRLEIGGARSERTVPRRFPNLVDRRTPHSSEKLFHVILSRMKMKQNKKFTLSDLRMAADKVWGAGLAENMVRLAINSGLVVLTALPRELNSSTKEGSI
jgi:hypothetical protein